jgi:hypothetical protein
VQKPSVHVNKDIKDSKDASHFEELNREAVELLKKEVSRKRDDSDSS